MFGITLGRLPISARIAITGYLAVIGVGYLLSMAQMRLSYTEQGVGAMIAHYHGEPARRDSIDAHWATLRADLLARYGTENTKTEKVEPSGDEVMDLGAFDFFAPMEVDPTAKTLELATSREDLLVRINEEHNRDLEITLQIPSVAHLISMGHNHTFGHAAFFVPLVVLVLFSSMETRPKTILAAAPFVGILFDYPMAIAARLWSPVFAVILIIGGAVMAISYTVIFVRALYELWFGPEARSGDAEAV
ncbi:MAG: hypothetical protein QGH20_09795 [Candidatus Latescibacteria bacterium]|jgi:hypothetical protein|nr:hypothetical protein [Candidatus Latescibacterota bacterium]